MSSKYLDHEIYLRPMTFDDCQLIKDCMTRDWGGEPLIVHEKKYYPSQMEGLLLFKEKELQGFLMYERQGKIWEIIVFEIFPKFKGLGTFVLNELVRLAKENKCTKIHVMTTNDNLDALRFYQRRHFAITAIHINAAEIARQMKPNIPDLGDFGIPLRDEIMLALTIS